jgi:hypothetical protein
MSELDSAEAGLEVSRGVPSGVGSVQGVVVGDRVPAATVGSPRMEYEVEVGLPGASIGPWQPREE